MTPTLSPSSASAFAAFMHVGNRVHVSVQHDVVAPLDHLGLAKFRIAHTERSTFSRFALG